MLHAPYILTNVYLETAFSYGEDNKLNATLTKLANLYIEDTKIQGIYFDTIPPALDVLEKVSGNFALALPGINDAHIHLDKTYYGGDWLAAEENKSVLDMIAIEKRLLPTQLPVMAQRAKAILDLIISKGATQTLAHCNVDQSIGIKHFIQTKAILEEYKNSITSKIAAFPQHGLYLNNTVPLMKEVMQLGCDVVGGLDPNTIDGNLQQSLDTTVQLALDYNAGIDIHLHERNETGKQTLQYLFKLMQENPTLQHNVSISHGFIFYDLYHQGLLEEYAEQMTALGIKLISGVPIQFRMPLAELRNLGVTVEVGSDSIMDHWYPFGQGDIIERINVIAQLYGWKGEYNLSQALYFATGITPLNTEGKMQWPYIGAKANINLFKASCSAEAIARVSPRIMTIHEGNITIL